MPRPDQAGFQAAATDVSSSAATLASYAARLHSPGGAGLSAYSAQAQLLALGIGPIAPVPPLVVRVRSDPPTGYDVGAPPLEIDACRRAVAAATGLLAGLGSTGFDAWGFASAMPADVVRLFSLVEDADLAVAELERRLAGCSEPVRAALATAIIPDDLERIGWLLTNHAVSPEVLDETRSRRWREARDELEARQTHLDTLAAPAVTMGPLTATATASAWPLPCSPS